MGGTLSIDSQAGGGSTVVVRLPVSVSVGAALHP
jgi:chemotaxis protein histidine kinase CheA